MWFWKSKSEKEKQTAGESGKLVVNAVRLTDSKAFRTNIVGESNYQGGLRSIAGGYRREGVRIEKLALLVPENSNNFDKNAVLVLIDDKKVGYLSRDDAVEFRSSMKRAGYPDRIAAVDALIVGGFTTSEGNNAHFGVRIDLSIPF